MPNSLRYAIPGSIDDTMDVISIDQGDQLRLYGEIDTRSILEYSVFCSVYRRRDAGVSNGIPFFFRGVVRPR
jgi:hypothetical protein